MFTYIYSIRLARWLVKSYTVRNIKVSFDPLTIFVVLRLKPSREGGVIFRTRTGKHYVNPVVRFRVVGYTHKIEFTVVAWNPPESIIPAESIPVYLWEKL